MVSKRIAVVGTGANGAAFGADMIRAKLKLIKQELDEFLPSLAAKLKL